MTLDKVNNLTRDQLRKLTLASEGTDVTNTEEHEYGYVVIEKIRWVDMTRTLISQEIFSEHR